MHNENLDLTTVKDPKGNHVLIPADYLEAKNRSYFGYIQETLTAPAFMLDIASIGIYYFKLINWQVNFMVQTRLNGSYFIVEECIENPTEDFVMDLLNKGGITSFD